MRKHKFLLGNPCGACEWHIEADIRTYAWFDFIFQSIFVIPVVLQLRINIDNAEDYYARSTRTTIAPTTSNYTSTTVMPANATDATNNLSSTEPTEEIECDVSKIHLGVLYSILDVVNLSMGVLTDIILYAGAKQHNLIFAKMTTWIFLICAVIREILHATGLSLHIIRCLPPTYPYEIVVRVLCQYMIYGFWIAMEYLHWLNRGKQFVPQRGLMELPPDMLEESETVTTIMTSTSDYRENFSGSPSIEITPPTDSGPFTASSELLKQKPPKPDSDNKKNKEVKPPDPAGDETKKTPKLKKKKKPSKQNMKTDEKPPENDDGPGKGNSKQDI